MGIVEACCEIAWYIFEGRGEGGGEAGRSASSVLKLSECLVEGGFRQPLREREHGWVPYFLFTMLRSA